MSPASHTRSRVITCRGARATEDRLMRELDAALGDMTDFARPVRVIVPSKSLRGHLLCRLVARRGAAVGVVVQTAYSAAREVLDRAGAPAPVGDGFLELVVRRLAASERALASSLDSLDDGYGTVIGVVRDLLDAGFQPAHEDAVLERLDDLERPIAARRLERARAIVRIAARCHEAMSATGSWRSAHAFEAAQALVREVGEAALPASSVLVHGFADVTGLVADFFEALARAVSTAILIDRPDRPGCRGRVEPGLRFLDRLEGRFSGFERLEDASDVGPPAVRLTEAGDVEAEARGVAERVRELIDGGVVPEQIGIVARRFDGLASPLRRHLGRLAVPFSGVGETVAGGGGRREVLRLVEVLRAGSAAPVDLWLEGRPAGAERDELLLALQETGAVRVEDVAEIGSAGAAVRGVRIHLALRDLDGNGGPTGTWVGAEAIRTAAREAAALCRVVDDWPRIAEPRVHADRTRSFVHALGWWTDGEPWQTVASLAAALARELAASPALERQEWNRLLSDRLAGVGDDPIGGSGGGVQLVNATEARARTFTHLFVVAFNRGIFPRVSGDDALFPDVIRARLAVDVLPEMPVRARSADEERYLFAQMVSASPQVEISWHLSAAGSAASRSPFVSDFLAGGEEPAAAPPVWSAERPGAGVRPAWEHAVLAAGRAPRSALIPVLEIAIAAAGPGFSPADCAALAAARADILDEADPEVPPTGLSPWFGFVGPEDGGGERGPTVTRVERVAECPWASFVTSRLGVAQRPDPQLGLPDPRGRLVGEVVHRVLERIVREGLGEGGPRSLEEAEASPEKAVAWPPQEHLESLLVDIAREVATAAGLGLRGMSSLLAARSRPYLEVARDTDWGPGGRVHSVVAVEVEGEAPGSGGARPVRFRADRVDRDASGLVLTDYKTGRPASDAKQEATRRRHLLRQVAKGRALQAAAYAAAGGGGSRGRYLWLRPDLGRAPEAERTAVVPASDPGFAAAYAEAVEAVAQALDAGTMFPRVEEVGSDRVPDHCAYCAVAEACRRDDSGFRRRLVEWMARGTASSRPEAAARRLWHLGAEREDPS